MASTYSPNLGIELMATGDQAGTWGTTTNNNLGTLIEQAISGYTTQVVSDNPALPTTLSMSSGSSCVARNIYLELTGTLTANRDLIVPNNKKLYYIFNNTTGGFSVTVRYASSVGTAVTTGSKVVLLSNGTDVVSAITTTGGGGGGTPGGSNTQVQYNSSGTFAGSPNLTFNGSTLSVSGINVGRGGGNILTNTEVGSSSLNANTTGTDNVAVGYQALYLNQGGIENTAVGSLALTSNVSGFDNTAIGTAALLTNTVGYYNTAIGAGALRVNNAGTENVAVGYQALYLNSNGVQNVAVGTGALTYNGSGTNNIAVGYQALYKTGTSGSSGYYNVAVGTTAGYNITSGSSNTTVGDSSGANILNGAGNSCFGDSSGINITSGTGNLCLGVNGGRSVTTGSYNIVIGGAYSPAYSITTQSNYISMGSSSVTNAYIQVAWTVTSDARDKTNFGTVPYGLDFVTKLNPVSYQFKMSRDDDTPNGDIRYGFKAQDILALEGDSPVIIDAKTPEKLYYNSDSMVPVLVNAIKDLKAELDALKAEIAALKGA